jgi:RNA polymerase sigma-70 factor, ECF subfamily
VLVKTQRDIRSYIAAMGVPLRDVDDLAQDVYLAFFRQRAERPAGVEAVAWLKGIARNHCMNYFRSQGRRSTRVMVQLAEIITQDPELQELTQSEERALEIFHGCMEKLSEDERHMLDWYYIDNCTAEVIGERLNRPPATVRVMMMRLREQLRVCMKQALAKS